MHSLNSREIELELCDGSEVTARCYVGYVLLHRGENLKLPLTSLGRAIFESDFEFVDEVIGTETEILLAINESFCHESLREIGQLNVSAADRGQCMEHELSLFIDESHEDWAEIEKHTGLKKAIFIEQLLKCELSVAMTGFLPGFVYLKGLPSALHVPRKSNPATRTSAGTFAIGGKYAGIYSIPSAAGWNCIGSVNQQIFDPTKLPPVSLGVGDRVRLKRVDNDNAVERLPSGKCASNDSVFDPQRGSLVFESSGLLSMLQDEGRAGLAWYAIPRSGPMDATAAELSNAIVGNASSSPVIECHLVAPRIRFESDATICMTGANMSWCLDGESMRQNRTIQVAKGSVLSGKAAKDGCRAYIAIHGEIDSSQTLGSSATYIPARFGGNWGKAFVAGDRLQWTKPASPPFPLQLKIQPGALGGKLAFEPGPEFEWMNSQSKTDLFANEYCVNSRSDRMGARLDGPLLSTNGKHLDDSVPLLPGMIQLTPEGQMIVVLQDGQTTGGYPRVGYLNRKSIEQLAQTKIGHPFCFEMAD